MNASFSAKRQGTLNRFFTRKVVGDLLVSQLGEFVPTNVLDLGSGEGSLSTAVVRRWNAVKSVTVDVDATNFCYLRANLEEAGASHYQHHVHDVLDPFLPSVLSEHGPFDLAVCNPPFYRPTWSREFARILQEADLAGACASPADVTAEILFLAQNLRALRQGGKVALIVPDSLMTGWRTAAFRRAIIATHRVDCVIQLPSHSFRDTEARCFLLILTKGAGPTEAVRLHRYETNAGLSSPLIVDVAAGEQRLDFDFHSNKSADLAMTSLRQLGADVRRGSITSAQRKSETFPTFHTTDFRHLDNARLNVETTALPADPRMVVASLGDVLIARVDRSLHTKIAIVTAGSIALTDCVYRVRIPTLHCEHVFNTLRSPAGAAAILSITKGVGARLLGKADLLDLALRTAI